MTAESAISQRVFCIGMNKTGTSTMKHCFEGLKLTPIASPTSYGPEIWKKIKHFYDHKNYSEMLDLAESYKTFEDRPWNMWSMYRRLYERFPDSFFILTVRDPESWWLSTERWITVTKPDVLARYQLHLRVQQVSKESMIESYLRYNHEVETYFQGTGRLLIMDFEKGDGWEPLCKFLDLPVPGLEFPHANRQLYNADDAETLKRKRLLKKGLQCQACKNVTIVKTKKKKSQGSVSGSLTSPGKLAAKARNFVVEDFQNSITIRKLLFGANRTFRSITKPFQGERSRAGAALAENELAVVSCFFNPAGSRRRAENFRAFLASVQKRGVRCLVVELAFGQNPHQITDHDDVIQLRTEAVLWHKERLLNIGIRRLLDDGVKKIAWLDGDIVFDDPTWPLEIANRLETSNLCQVFETISITTHEAGAPMLARSGVRYFQESGELFEQLPSTPGNLLRGMLKGGQSGFGWAARAEVLEQVTLFENAVVGGGDKLIMAASLADDLTDPRIAALTHSKISCRACGHKNRSSAYTENYLEWAQKWSKAVNGSVDYARLHIGDMYHGQRSDRGYTGRHDILYTNDFDPKEDLRNGASNCLEWSTSKSQLQHQVEAYFLSRREDI